MSNAKSRFRNHFVATALLAGGLSLGGCATEQYVDEHIATAMAGANARIDQTNGRIDGVETRLAETDRTARDAVQRADAAGAAAQAAASAAQAAGADAMRANEDIAKVKASVDHLNNHHRHKTWRDVSRNKSKAKRRR